MIGVAIALAAIAIGNHLASSANKEANELSTAERHPANAVLRPGEAAFIQPGDMRVGSWYSLEFIAGPNLRAINEEAEDLPTTRPRAILVSRDMRVVLLPAEISKSNRSQRPSNKPAPISAQPGFGM